jgi:aspartyl protease family protein
MFGLDGDSSARLTYLVLLLVFLLVGVAFGRGLGGLRLRDLAVWVLIGLGLVTVYAYRAPLIRFATPVLQELDPSRVVEIADDNGDVELVVARAGDGHFHVDAAVNGTPLRFLIDTGASATVLTLDDARRAGINVGALEFNRPVQTANGIAFYAQATAESLSIGPFRMRSVPVGVMSGNGLGVSLLGMSTINRFDGWRVEGNRLILRP